MLNLSTPQPIEPPRTANCFGLAHWDVTADRVLSIWWNAYDKTEAGDLTVVANLGPATFEAEALEAVCADALTKAKDYEAAGLTAAQAYALGQRDALYAALQADGHIPTV